MPSAGDPFLLGPLPVSHDPLSRIDFNVFQTDFDLAAFLETTIQFIEDIFFDLIFDLTGIDLRSISDLVESIFTQIVDQILAVFGLDLGALGSFETDFISLLTVILDKLGNIVYGDVPPLDMFDIIGNILSAIPGINVTGIGGPADVLDTIQETWNQLIGGLVGSVGAGSGLADLFNIAQEVSSRATLGLFSWDILGIRSNKSLNTGFLSTSESNISLDKVALAGSAPTFALTQSTAITAFQRISESASKGAVSWLGSGVTSITHAFVNIYQMNTLTGDLTLVHESANIIGNLSATMQYNIYDLPIPIDVEAGEVYGVEISIRGAGTHSIVGSSTWLPDHPSVYPRRLSSIRDSGTSAPPSTIAAGSVTYTTNVPMIEFAVSSGDVSIPHTPQTFLFNAPGSTNMPIPSWANSVERVVLGGGGGGRRGGTWNFTGEGGDNGVWVMDTLVRGVDFTGSPTISINVAAGGAGGSPGTGDSGGTGGTTTVTISGNTITATGGAGGNDLEFGGPNKNGQSPGNATYGGVTYMGGVTQSTYGAPGAQPGGGGAGGSDFAFQNGGSGAAGAVWIRFRQTDPIGDGGSASSFGVGALDGGSASSTGGDSIDGGSA